MRKFTKFLTNQIQQITFKIISIEITFEDQTQTEVAIRTTIDIVPIHTLVIYFIQTIDKEILQITETGITQIIEIDNNQTIDNEIIQTTDLNTTITTTDHKIILEIETIIIQIDKEISFSRHIEKLQIIKTHIKIIEAVHPNIKDI